MVSLLSKEKRALVVNLPHDVVCKDECKCTQTVHLAREHNGKTGEVHVRRVPRSINRSVHLIPGVWSDALPDSAVEAPGIAERIKSRKIVSRDVSDSAAAA